MKIERIIRQPYHRSKAEEVVITLLGGVALFALAALIFYITP